MSWREKLVGFYSIMDVCDENLARRLVTPVAQGGAGSRVLQVRIKRTQPAPTAEILVAARLARRVTRALDALLIVNDRLDIALAVDADGVHLGQNDLPLADARKILRDKQIERPFLVGISTHDREQVLAAVRDGADYLGYGPVYSTNTKVDPDPVQGLDGLRMAVQAAGETPVVAIGGITPERAGDIAATGAAAACAISSVNQAENPVMAGARITEAFASKGKSRIFCN